MGVRRDDAIGEARGDCLRTARSFERGLCPRNPVWGRFRRGPPRPPPTNLPARGAMIHGKQPRVSETVAVLGPGRIGRQIALKFALGGWGVVLVDLKDRSVAERVVVLACRRREVVRDVAALGEGRRTAVR